MEEKPKKTFKEMQEERNSNKKEFLNPESKNLQGIDRLKLKVAEDLRIDSEKLKDEISKNGNLYHYYLELYINEKKDLGKLERIYDKAFKSLYHKYRFENEFRLKTSSEIQIYIDGDPRISKVKEMINNSKISIEYLEKVLDLFKMRSFALKNMVEMIKLESGGFA